MADQPTFENENTHLSFQQRDAEDKFHQSYDQAVEEVRKKLGGTFPLRIGGEEIETSDTFTVVSPADRTLEIGTFAAAGETEAGRAVESARGAFDAWRKRSYGERVEVFERAADIMADRKFELAAWMTFENGKNRIEAMADVDEAIDFLRFYSQEVRRHKGFAYDTGEPSPGQHCTSMLRPYGVFAVISPFNFPLAILVGMTTGALITGNTAVVKPASATPRIAHVFFDILDEAGLPEGVANLVTGGGRSAGQPLLEHPDVQGVVFTGSREVGTKTEHLWLEEGKRGPVIAELGGKNAVIVSDKADLDKAVQGCWYGTVGYGGQKCSATSRIYVHGSVAEEFTRRLAERIGETVVDLPWKRNADLGPVIGEGEAEYFQEIVEKARADGEVLAGGEVLDEGDLAEGNYVAPAVVTGLPHDHELVRNEHFLPFVTVHTIESLDEGLERVNDSDYALTSGLFSEDGDEVRQWLDEVEAGVIYVNRARSATTGALVQGQPFGGWKHSGTTGKFAGGYWYLPQFMKEQTRTIVTQDEE